MSNQLEALKRTAPVIKVNGAPLSIALSDRLTYARVELGLGVIGRVTLRFVDTDHAIATGSDFGLGHKVEVEIAQTKIVEAYVTGATISQQRGSLPEFVVTADDAAYKLTRAITPAAYDDMTYSDVLIKLAGDAGVQISAEATSEPHPYQFVSGTALSYLEAVTRRIGQVWWIDPNGKLVTKGVDSISDVVSTAVDDLGSLSIRESALHSTNVHAIGWDPATKQPVDASALGERNGVFEEGPMGHYSNASALSSADAKLSGLNPISRSEAETVSHALLTEVIDSTRVLRGETEADETYAPGKKLRIINSNAFSGEFLLSSVEHIYRPGEDFLTRFVAGPHRPTGLVDTLGNAPHDPGLNHTQLIPAIVTNCDDPDKLGRIKVKYIGVPGSVQSGWARMATVGAGLNRGIVFLPEINDEVIIGFEGGDIRRPVVLGGLYNGKDTPPPEPLKQAQGETNVRRLVGKQGNFIEFGDGTGDTENHVKLAMKGSSELRIGKDQTTLDTKGKPLKITVGSAVVEIDDKGNVKISGDTISLKATKDLTLEGLNVTVKATQKIAVSGNIGEVKAMGQLNLEATGQASLKGAMVMIN